MLRDVDKTWQDWIFIVHFVTKTNQMMAAKGKENENMKSVF